jgi:hypothetical protein
MTKNTSDKQDLLKKIRSLAERLNDGESLTSEENSFSVACIVELYSGDDDEIMEKVEALNSIENQDLLVDAIEEIEAMVYEA